MQSATRISAGQHRSISHLLAGCFEVLSYCMACLCFSPNLGSSDCQTFQASASDSVEIMTLLQAYAIPSFSKQPTVVAAAHPTMF